MQKWYCLRNTAFKHVQFKVTTEKNFKLKRAFLLEDKLQTESLSTNKVNTNSVCSQTYCLLKWLVTENIREKERPSFSPWYIQASHHQGLTKVRALVFGENILHGVDSQTRDLKVSWINVDVLTVSANKVKRKKGSRMLDTGSLQQLLTRLFTLSASPRFTWLRQPCQLHSPCVDWTFSTVWTHVERRGRKTSCGFSIGPQSTPFWKVASQDAEVLSCALS